ncbi:MAG: hypothetical protein Tsb0020_36970 [Haliangiales bacterium]
MFEHIQDEVNARIDAFVADISELAREAARDALSNTLGAAGAAAPRRHTASAAGSAGLLRGGRPQRSGGKRTAEEIAETAEALFAYISANPGQRMEAIAREMNATTQELTLPIRKLLEAERITTEGQKRATSYFPAEASASPSTRRRRQKRN